MMRRTARSENTAQQSLKPSNKLGVASDEDREVDGVFLQRLDISYSLF